MKLFKNKHFRNFLHILIGAILGYILTLTYNGVPFIVQLFITTFVVGGIGVMWEWFWRIKTLSEIDYNDVIRAVVPAILINILCVLF